MRTDRISVPYQQHRVLQQPSVRSNDPLPLTSRRNFLGAFGLGLGAVCLNPTVIFADEANKPSLIEMFNSALVVYKKDENAYKACKEKISCFAKESPLEFLSWYENIVRVDSKDESFPLVLEDVGNTIIRDFDTSIPNAFIQAELEKEKIVNPDSDQITVRKSQHLSKILSAYMSLVERNPLNRSIIQNAFELSDFAIYPTLQSFRRSDLTCVQKLKTKQVVADDYGNKIISLYDAALKGVRRLHEENPSNVDTKIKVLINEFPWDSEGFDDRPDLQDKIVNSLSENYFRLKRASGDSEGLQMMISKLTGNNSFNIGSCSSGWSPYIVLNLIEKNPEYFEAAAKKCAEDIKANSDSVDDPLSAGSLFLKFFASENLLKLNQQFRFTSNSANGIPIAPIPVDAEIPENDIPSAVHYPPVSSKTKRNVINLSNEKISKPIIESLFERVKSEKVISEDRDAGRGYTERYVEDSSWINLNSNLSTLMTLPVVGKGIEKIVDSRIEENNSPYDKEMLYVTRSKIKPSESKYDFPALVKALSNQADIQGVRGLAYMALSDLNCSENGQVSTTDFFLEIKKILEMKKEYDRTFIPQGTSKEEEEKLRERHEASKYWPLIVRLSENEQLSPTQKLVASSIRIFYGDLYFGKDLMPERKFPPPTRKVVYIESGKEHTLEGAINDKELQDKVSSLEKNKSITIVSNDLVRSKECLDDYNALYRMSHNAALFLTYLGALSTSDSNDNRRVVVSNSNAFKKLIVTLMEERFYSTLSLNLFSEGFDKLGEKIGALLELYGTIENRGKDSQDYLSKKEKALTGLLFDFNDEAKGTYGVYGSLFKGMRESAEDAMVRYIANKFPNRKVLGEKYIFDHLFNYTIDSREHKIIVNAIKASKDFEKEKSEIHKDLEKFKAMVAKGCLNTARHRKLQETRETLARIGDGSLDRTMLLDPYKYLKDLYKIEVSSSVSDKFFSGRDICYFSGVDADNFISAVYC